MRVEDRESVIANADSGVVPSATRSGGDCCFTLALLLAANPGALINVIKFDIVSKRGNLKKSRPERRANVTHTHSTDRMENGSASDTGASF